MKRLFFVSFVVALFATSCCNQAAKTVAATDSIAVDSVKTTVVDTVAVTTVDSVTVK